MDSKRRIKNIWYLMKSRCEHENDKDFKNYGARGVFVCDQWQEFESFYQWSIKHGYCYGLSIDRIDNDGEYAPWNCRWVDAKTQCNNKRTNLCLTYQGKTQTIAEWADETGLPFHALWRRIAVYQWDSERALTTPCGKRRYIEYNGETHRLFEWAKILNMDYDMLEARINRHGWSIERALTQPAKTVNAF